MKNLSLGSQSLVPSDGKARHVTLLLTHSTSCTRELLINIKELTCYISIIMHFLYKVHNKEVVSFHSYICSVYLQYFSVNFDEVRYGGIHLKLKTYLIFANTDPA